jgi:hypothetical protein
MDGLDFGKVINKENVVLSANCSNFLTSSSWPEIIPIYMVIKKKKKLKIKKLKRRKKEKKRPN